jgi:hypothetical protein
MSFLSQKPIGLIGATLLSIGLMANPVQALSFNFSNNEYSFFGNFDIDNNWLDRYTGLIGTPGFTGSDEYSKFVNEFGSPLPITNFSLTTPIGTFTEVGTELGNGVGLGGVAPLGLVEQVGFDLGFGFNSINSIPLPNDSFITSLGFAFFQGVWEGNASILVPTPFGTTLLDRRLAVYTLDSEPTSVPEPSALLAFTLLSIGGLGYRRYVSFHSGSKPLTRQ